MQKPIIISPTDRETWEEISLRTIEKVISDSLSQRAECNIFLTGGKTVETLYVKWSERLDKIPGRINFFWSDERHVPLDSNESNYCMAMKTLFKLGIPKNCRVFPFETSNGSPELAAQHYEKQIPDTIDLIILSMGVDSHIASLFPGSDSLLEATRQVITVKSPKPPLRRLTITPAILKKASHILLFVIGSEKGKIAANALDSQLDIIKYPVCLALNGIWVMDKEAIKHNRGSLPAP